MAGAEPRRGHTPYCAERGSNRRSGDVGLFLCELSDTQKNEAIQKGNLAERQRTLAEQKTAEADQRQVDLQLAMTNNVRPALGGRRRKRPAREPGT